MDHPGVPIADGQGVADGLDADGQGLRGGRCPRSGADGKGSEVIEWECAAI